MAAKKILSDAMKARLKMELQQFQGKPSARMMHQIDFTSKYGVLESEVRSGFIDITENDGKIEEQQEEKIRENEEYITTKLERVDDWVRNSSEGTLDETDSYRPSKLDLLDARARELSRRRNGMDEDY